jgi:hypothetical protein
VVGLPFSSTSRTQTDLKTAPPSFRIRCGRLLNPAFLLSRQWAIPPRMSVPPELCLYAACLTNFFRMTRRISSLCSRRVVHREAWCHQLTSETPTTSSPAIPHHRTIPQPRCCRAASAPRRDRCTRTLPAQRARTMARGPRIVTSPPSPV